jgi:glycolate oxidase iron-sulfur subunit
MLQNQELLQTSQFQSNLAQCIHCGLCLQACPTYRLWGTETDAPRGRISLMRAASGGRLSVDDFVTGFPQHIDFCLACRSCESACPSGVRYGALVEQVRIFVETNRKPGWGERFLRWIGLQQLMPRPRRLRWLAGALYLYQEIGLQSLVRRLKFLPGTLQAMEALLPPLQAPSRMNEAPPLVVNTSRGRLLLFTGCIQDGFLNPVNRATRRVLACNGYEVVSPIDQTCCGAAHLHLGDLEMARKLARQNIEAFEQAGDQAVIICNAGGCGLSLKEYPHLLAGDPNYAARAVEFSARVQDVCEFLSAHLTVPPKGRLPLRATYADSCHLRHGQKIVNEPRDLLRQINGLELVELQSPDQCCGSAGVYNFVHPGPAGEILKAKLADIAATGAELIVASNPGCQLQLIAGVRQVGMKAQVLHVVEVLDRAYQAESA